VGKNHKQNVGGAGGNSQSSEAQVLSRRKLLGTAVAAGAALGVAGTAGAGPAFAGADGPRRWARPTVATTPAQRAIAGLKALNLGSGYEINVYAEDLTIDGPRITQKKFEQQSGLKLKPLTAPFLQYFDKVFTDAATKAGTYDIVFAEHNRLGDLDAAGYLTDLTSWVKKYDPGLSDFIAPQNRIWSMYNGKYLSLPTDGDVFMFYYRKDLLESPKERAAFKAKYNRPLAVPQSWDDYNQVAEFFTRPDQKMYGAVEWRVKGVVYWWFWQRLWSLGGTYFNTKDMSAAINSKAGVQALTDLKAANKFMPPDVLSYGYAETVAAMTGGTTFSNITWPAAGKNANDPKTSKTVGKWGYALVPGYAKGGKVNHKSMSAPGYGMVVSNVSKKNKEACYLYCQWFTSPENLIVADNNPAGNTDVLRRSIFNNPIENKIFPGAKSYNKMHEANLAHAVPDPILPGYTKYSDALEIEISNFMTGSKSAKQALDDAAKAWDKITDSYGKSTQLAVYKNFLKAYGSGAKSFQ
jgi:multiple sugar transport system substrate-binding protein